MSKKINARQLDHVPESDARHFCITLVVGNALFFVATKKYYSRKRRGIKKSSSLEKRSVATMQL